MEMKIEPISPGVTKVVLSGRMDAAGAARIDLPFSAVAGGNRGVIVDMSSVDFLASIGIRTLMLGAKTMQRRGGTLVLLAPQTTVLEVLEVTGVLDLLPVVATLEAASARVGD